MRFLSRSFSTLKPPACPSFIGIRDLEYVHPSKRVGFVAKKIGMMSDWDEWGVHTPITILQGIENQVVRSMQGPKGEWSIEVAVDKVQAEHNISTSLLLHLKRFGIPAKRKIYGYQVSDTAILPSGLMIGVHHFVPGQYVDVQSESIGKGFQGGMKRWGFSGLPASHGVSLSHRSIGSTGNRHDPGKVFKGKKMPGRMGGDTVTIKALKIMKIDTVYGLIYLKGEVPGNDMTYVRLKDALIKGGSISAFPAGIKVPYPTNFQKLTELPRELISEPIEGSTDTLSRQRHERTG